MSVQHIISMPRGQVLEPYVCNGIKERVGFLPAVEAAFAKSGAIFP